MYSKMNLLLTCILILLSGAFCSDEDVSEIDVNSTPDYELIDTEIGAENSSDDELRREKNWETIFGYKTTESKPCFSRILRTKAFLGSPYARSVIITAPKNVSSTLQHRFDVFIRMKLLLYL